MSDLRANLILSTVAQCAEATGLSVWCIAAIKRASRGQPDCPWCSRFTTATRIRKWVFDHPEFVARRAHCSKSTVTPFPAAQPHSATRTRQNPIPNTKTNTAADPEPERQYPSPTPNPTFARGRAVGHPSGLRPVFAIHCEPSA